jgi:electron transfer flavoprotein alpha/beta subunit
MTVLTVKAEIKVPRVPNFLRMTDGQSLPICAVTEEDLRKLGAVWIENLIERAREQAKDRKSDD